LTKLAKHTEETLDPENWDEMNELGHRMLNDMMEYLKTIREQPFIPPTEDSKKAIFAPLPNKGDGEERVYDIVRENVIPYSVKWIRPDFWGFVIGTGSPYGMLTEMLISGMNYADEPWFIGKHFVKQSLDWVKEMLDYPKEGGGVFVSGSSEANFTGLAVARNAKAEVDMKVDGMQGVPRKMTLYCSEEAHACLDRSVELLGLGNGALRWIRTDDDCRIAVDALIKSIKDDRQQGYHPFCVIGNAGTVNSGAFDDFNSLADLCRKENLWFHVDGAFGAWVKLSETHRHLTDGMERADSLAVDLHKWMNMPYGIGCTLVRDRKAHYSTFVYGHEAAYIKTAKALPEDLLADSLHLSLPLSRTAYSLKAYMLLRAYGRDKYCKLVQQNIDQINHLAELIRKEPNLEITAPVSSNIACFRYIYDGLNEADTQKINRLILNELWKINFGLISDTTIRGKYMLRACNVNHRTHREDFDWLVSEVRRLGEKLLPEVKKSK